MEYKQVSGVYVSDSGNRRVDLVERGSDHAHSSLVSDSINHISSNSHSQQYNDFDCLESGAFYTSDIIPQSATSFRTVSQSIENEVNSSGTVIDNSQGYYGTFEADANQINESSKWPLTKYKLQHDPNPLVLKKTINESATCYQQNIHVRFLKPPALPAPGPLIIKEIRAPQVAPAPPLIIRQRPLRIPTPPPIVLRERPPQPPAIASTQIITKKLPPLPPPPRQVIVERYPPSPPKPRDVIIERWLPYDPLPKRKVIYQRANAKSLFKAKKNLIIHYERSAPLYNRVFKKHGIYEVDPRTYVSHYGNSLLNSSLLLDSARRAGVHEDISIPPTKTNSLITNTTKRQDVHSSSDIVTEATSVETSSGGIEKSAFTHSYESLNLPKNVPKTWISCGGNYIEDGNVQYSKTNCMEQELSSQDTAYVDNLINHSKHKHYQNKNSNNRVYDFYNNYSIYDSGIYGDSTYKSMNADFVYGSSGNKDGEDFTDFNYLSAPSNFQLNDDSFQYQYYYGENADYQMQGTSTMRRDTNDEVASAEDNHTVKC